MTANGSPNTAIAIDSPRPPASAAAMPAKPLLDDQPDDPNAFTTQLLERVPVDRIQRMLRTNTALRVVEAAVGATLVGYELRQANGTSTLAQVGVHAIKFSGSEWLESQRLHVEPQVHARGFAISFTTRD